MRRFLGLFGTPLASHPSDTRSNSSQSLDSSWAIVEHPTEYDRSFSPHDAAGPSNSPETSIQSIKPQSETYRPESQTQQSTAETTTVPPRVKANQDACHKVPRTSRCQRCSHDANIAFRSRSESGHSRTRITSSDSCSSDTANPEWLALQNVYAPENSTSEEIGTKLQEGKVHELALSPRALLQQLHDRRLNNALRFVREPTEQSRADLATRDASAQSSLATPIDTVCRKRRKLSSPGQ